MGIDVTPEDSAKLRAKFPPEAFVGYEIQHRIARGRGGTKDPGINSMANLVLVCSSCHDCIERRERAQAYETGWAIKHGQELPSDVPLVDVYGRKFWLTDEGDVFYPEGATR